MKIITLRDFINIILTAPCRIGETDENAIERALKVHYPNSTLEQRAAVALAFGNLGSIFITLELERLQGANHVNA